MTVAFAVERFADIAFEIAQLVEPHWQEVGSFQDEFERQIDYAAYEKLEAEGRLLTVTARADGTMFGYFIGVIGLDLHRVTKGNRERVPVCSALVYYVTPPRRGHARGLMKAVEAAAVERGCQILNVRVKRGLNAADAFFAKIGYSEIEVTMTSLIGDAASASRSRSKVA